MPVDVEVGGDVGSRIYGTVVAHGRDLGDWPHTEIDLGWLAATRACAGQARRSDGRGARAGELTAR